MNYKRTQLTRFCVSQMIIDLFFTRRHAHLHLISKDDCIALYTILYKDEFIQQIGNDYTTLHKAITKLVEEMPVLDIDTYDHFIYILEVLCALWNKTNSCKTIHQLMGKGFIVWDNYYGHVFNISDFIGLTNK